MTHLTDAIHTVAAPVLRALGRTRQARQHPRTTWGRPAVGPLCRLTALLLAAGVPSRREAAEPETCGPPNEDPCTTYSEPAK